MFGRRHRRIAQAEAAAAKRVVKKQQAALMPAKKPILLRLFNRFSSRFPRVTGAKLQTALLVLAIATVANAEEKPGAGEMGVSVMLMGAISVMMSIFYLVNVDDEDFQKYSWTVISATISIFAAVLVFSGINGCVEYFLLPDCEGDETPEINGCYVEGEDKERMELIVNFTHLGVWWTLLQFTLATITGAIEPFEACKKKQIDALPDEEIASHVHAKVEEHVIQASKHLLDQKALGNKGWDSVHLAKAVDKAKPWLRQQVHAQYLQAQRHGHEVNEQLLQEEALNHIDHMVTNMDSESTKMKLCLKSYAVLMGHTTGFAAINAWGTVQQQTTGEDRDDVLMAWLCVPLAFCVTFSIQLLMDKVRDYIALGDDGIKDESEVLWDEAVEETEDDVMSLACSFLMAQAMRLTVCGDWQATKDGEWLPSTLPNGEGGEDEYREKNHPATESVLLFCAGLAVMGLDMARYIYTHSGKKEPETNLDGTDQEEEKEPRVGVQVRNITMMFFSWCVYFSSDWTVKGTVAKVDVLGENAMMGQTFLALSLTGIAFFAIFVLDKIADSAWTPEAADKCIEEAVFSLAFLIGFGWEKTFDMAVEKIAEFMDVEEHIKPDCITKLVLGMLLALLVVPAWRLYILPNIIAYEEAEEAKKETEKESEKEWAEEMKKAQNLSKVVSRGLDEPLLAKAPKKDRTDKLYPSIATVGQAKVAMRDMEAQLIKERKEHTDAKLKNETIDAVIAKNQQNEATIDGFSREVNELQKLTEKLTSGV